MATATTAGGVRVPAGGDPFDPQGDMVELANSMRSRLIYPVANTTARAALLAALDWTPSTAEPLRVSRADAPPGLEVETTTDGGTTWRTTVSGAVYAHAARTSDAAIATGSVTDLSWTGADTTLAGITVATNTVFTVPRAGRYQVTYGLVWATSGAGARNTWVEKNGTTRVIEADLGGSSAGGVTTGGSRVLDLAAGDTLKVRVFQNSGGTLAITGSGGIPMWLTIDYLGPQ